MDLFGIVAYVKQWYYTSKTWLAKERGSYTNRDLLVDQAQILVFAIIIAKALLS